MLIKEYWNKLSKEKSKKLVIKSEGVQIFIRINWSISNKLIVMTISIP